VLASFGQYAINEITHTTRGAGDLKAAMTAMAARMARAFNGV